MGIEWIPITSWLMITVEKWMVHGQKGTLGSTAYT